MTTDTTSLLTWWSSADGVTRVECARHRGAFRVRVRRADWISSELEAETEVTARKLFEGVVEGIGG